MAEMFLNLCSTPRCDYSALPSGQCIGSLAEVIVFEESGTFNRPDAMVAR